MWWAIAFYQIHLVCYVHKRVHGLCEHGAAAAREEHAELREEDGDVRDDGRVEGALSAMWSRRRSEVCLALVVLLGLLGEGGEAGVAVEVTGDDCGRGGQGGGWALRRAGSGAEKASADGRGSAAHGGS